MMIIVYSATWRVADELQPRAIPVYKYIKPPADSAHFYGCALDAKFTRVAGIFDDYTVVRARIYGPMYDERALIKPLKD